MFYRQQAFFFIGVTPLILNTYTLYSHLSSKFMWLVFGNVVLCYVCAYFLFDGLGLLSKRNQKIVNDQEIDDKSTGGKREQQHQIILAVINALNYEPLEIPTGGKSKIKEVCLKNARMFTDSSFDHAWKNGTNIGLFRLLDSDKFSSK